jgi:hypothetical protein
LQHRTRLGHGPLEIFPYSLATLNVDWCNGDCFVRLGPSAPGCEQTDKFTHSFTHSQ